MNARDIENAILDAIVESRYLPGEFDKMLDSIADTWRDLSPVGTGEYRRGIKTESYGARLSSGGLRRGTPVGRAYHDGDLEKAWAIEAGTADTPAFHPMMRTYARFMT